MAQIQQNKHMQVMSRLTELPGIRVTLKTEELGEVRGVIEQITAPAIAEDFQSSVNLTQFKVRLESGDVVTVPGSAFSKIDFAA